MRVFTRPLVQRICVVILTALFGVGCAGPTPAPPPTQPQALATLPWSDTLPPDGWFSIRATGRTSPFQNDLVVVYQSGRAIYLDQSSGQQFESKLDEASIATWRRMFESQARFMSLNDNYPPGTPFSPDDYPKDSPQANDAIRYTLIYRNGDAVKTVTASKSGAPVKLAIILDQFWSLVADIKLASSKESLCLFCSSGL